MRRCRLKESGEVYALKQMCKADIVAMGQVAHTASLYLILWLHSLWLYSQWLY